jgi:stage II sporulation protein AB (anti-sigma F factor)
MKPINEVALVFPSKSSNESFARLVASALVSQLDPTIEELADVRTAVSEAVTNAIIHGYENEEGNIKMNLKLYSDSIEIIIEDQGQGIMDIDLARQPLYTSKPEMERSGMGFTVMETFMDRVDVVSKIGEGTKIIMFKTFESLKK